MEYIITIAEEKRQSRAADKLMISQPALSQQVRKVEEEFGAKLFEKDGADLALTDAGRIYVNGARAILSLYNNTLADIAKIRTRRKKEITLIYNSTLLMDIQDTLSRFSLRHPDIFISTITGNQSVAREYLMAGMADIAILARENTQSAALDLTDLFKDEVLLALPHGDPRAKAFRQSGIDFSLLADDFFILNESGSYIDIAVSARMRDAQFTPHGFCRIADMYTTINMVQNNRGIAFIPQSMAEIHDCETIPLDPPVHFHICAATRKNHMMTAAQSDLVRIFQDQYNTLRKIVDDSSRL